MIRINRISEMQSSMSFTATILLFTLFFISHTVSYAQGGEDDEREYQHGIDFIPLSDGQYALIWSSSEDPLDVTQSNTWEHDVYYSFIDVSNPIINPINIISRNEAQEPASSAITSDGHIMITMEDGWNPTSVLEQRYGVYNNDFSPTIRAYPQVVPVAGGHSGHVAAVDNRFVIFYSEEWVEGGGVDDLGSGDDVFAAVYDSVGKFKFQYNIAVGDATRDWWPWVEGSDNYAFMIWQRFVNNALYADLMISIMDPITGDLTVSEKKIETNMEYYTYSVAPIPETDNFLVLGVHTDGTGFGILFDKDGKELTRNNNLPPIVRESQSIVRVIDGIVFIAQARNGGGIMLLKLTDTEKIELVKTIDDSYRWQYAGTDGIWLNDSEVYIASLSRTGLVEKKYDINAVGFNETKSSKSNIYPTLVKSEITINTGIVNGVNSIEIYNINGSLILETLIDNGQAIDISSFESGVYIVKNNNTNVNRFIKN